MKRILIQALIGVALIFPIIAPTATAQTKLVKDSPTLVWSMIDTDSTEVDTSGWYRPEASTSTVMATHKSLVSSTPNPLCTLVVDLRWPKAGTFLYLARDAKLLADSTETVHFYKINWDSLGQPDFRFRMKSWRDNNTTSLSITGSD